jgi:hypothetical protein
MLHRISVVQRLLIPFRTSDVELRRKFKYPVPKISTTLQELEGFTYATTLDLNMGYYIDPTAAEMCTIIFTWGKYLYQRFPMDLPDQLIFSKQKWGT